MMSILTKDNLKTIKIINTVPIETDQYYKCKSEHAEIIDGRLRVAFVRCPKCRSYISVYKDDIGQNGQTQLKKCINCGLHRSLKLKNW